MPDAPLVLLIDDDAATTRVLGMFLETDGFAFVTASDRQKGLDQMRLRMPDAIVMDYLIGGLGPAEFMEQGRSLGYVAGPVVLCTGLKQDFEDLAVDHILYKPFDPEVLGKKLTELLSRESA